MNEKVDWNPSHYGNGDDINNTRHFKFISFSINNRWGHLKQLITMLKIVQKVIKSEIDVINKNTNENLSNHGNSNTSSYKKCPKFINFQSTINQVIWKKI